MGQQGESPMDEDVFWEWERGDSGSACNAGPGVNGVRSGLRSGPRLRALGIAQAERSRPARSGV